MKPATVTQAITSTLPQLRKSERKVAEYVLQHPDEVILMRIVDLAQHAHVSEPTVVRFCRAAGFDGFQAFKLSLAQQLASSPGYGQIAVTDTDSARQYTVKVFDSTIDTLLKVRDAIDPEQLNRAVEALCNAGRVEIYGFGASAAVAADAQHKFFRLQLASAAYADPHLQNMSTTSLRPGDVVLAISQSGRTRILIDAIERVCQRGGTVVALAPTGSPVAKTASIAITIDVEEDFEIYTPLSSRLAHLVVIDAIAIGIAQRRGAALRDHLREMHEGLETLRL